MKKNHEVKTGTKATNARSFNKFKRFVITKVQQRSLKGGNDIIIDDVGDH